mgnify:CR=1 FL=1
MAKTKPNSKKPCPDLVGMSDSDLENFWKTNQPENLKWLGDRLLAESLPRFEPRSDNFYPDLIAIRETAHRSLEQVAELLDTNPAVLLSWEEGRSRPPASLCFIYRQHLSQ